VTPVRSIPPDFDSDVVAAIERRLLRLETEHNMTIVWAVESGSRAWGFPSPDSDYDCRFIYIRPLTDYLTLSPKRDVIEVPIEEGLDVVGWDLFKMAKLLLKGNAAAIEWLMSPIVYRGFEEFRDDWCKEAKDLVDQPTVTRHYYHLGRSQLRKYISDPEAVALKKIFYVLRPAVVLRWMRMNPEQAVAPMHLPTLIAETAIRPATHAEIATLLAKKALTREMGQGPLPGRIAKFIRSEYEQAHELLKMANPLASPDQQQTARLERLVRHWIWRCEAGAKPLVKASTVTG
jgi:predicted nucleotidyltransferase